MKTVVIDTQIIPGRSCGGWKEVLDAWLTEEQLVPPVFKGQSAAELSGLGMGRMSESPGLLLVCCEKVLSDDASVV